MTRAMLAPPVWSIPDCDYRLRVVLRSRAFWSAFPMADLTEYDDLVDQLLAQRFDLAMAEAAELAHCWVQSAGPGLPVWPVAS